ncbi:LytTR family DNA-binding domain-containing protein [Emticicia sp. 17c]|uniref:LytTR family DNA-binding domain-containing protein n=1 Tax=Emticicia sp. 17c TaxID=3127704 RepID=UPI00301B77A1
MKTTPSKKQLRLLQNAPKRIIKLVANANYTTFYLSNGKSVLMSYSLKRYQDYLSYPFIRVNKSCIANMFFLENLCPVSKKIKLEDGSEIRISRRRYNTVCKNISL